MAVSDEPSTLAESQPRETLYARAYRVLAYFGLMTVFASLLYGFRHDPNAPSQNYGFDLALYAAFIAPHLVLTRSWWKRSVWGDPAGSPRERRVYILLTIVTWLAVLHFHRPLPGPGLTLPTIVRFVGLVGFLWALLFFFEGSSRAALDGLLGVPGTVLRFSHGSETPLFTEGQYSQVRHPMYRAAILAGMCSLLVHPHVAQLVWSLTIGATFIAFIPIEEAQLLAARGDDYRRYRQQTPYRLFRGIW